MTDQVLFFPKPLIADLIDFIDQLFDVIRPQISCGKGPLHKAAL